MNGLMVPNPIFAGGRPAAHVFYAAIVGVPWQLIARQKNGVPDLVGGVSAIIPTVVGGFKDFEELSLPDVQGHPFWDDIAGDPENYVPARSPFMVESTVPRSGTDPITGAAIAPVTTTDGQGSKVGGSLLNDHERTIRNPPDDIEYACIFDLPTPRDCTTAGTSCDCPNMTGVTTDNPLCDPTKPTSQIKAKAYPGIKHLAIAKGLGAQGIVGSICPKQLTDPTAPDYAYRPSVKAIVDRLKPVLRAH
jgi:hypothetical protein